MTLVELLSRRDEISATIASLETTLAATQKEITEIENWLTEHGVDPNDVEDQIKQLTKEIADEEKAIENEQNEVTSYLREIAEAIE